MRSLSACATTSKPFRLTTPLCFEAAPALGDEHGSLVFTGGEDDPETLDTLIRMGFERPSDVSAAIRGWHFGRFAATRSAKARERLTEIMPVLLDALARTGQPRPGVHRI